MPVRWTGRAASAAAGVLVTSFLWLVYVVDPTRRMITPPCPYLTLTGLACPGCGLGYWTRGAELVREGEVDAVETPSTQLPRAQAKVRSPKD